MRELTTKKNDFESCLFLWFLSIFMYFSYSGNYIGNEDYKIYLTKILNKHFLT